MRTFKCDGCYEKCCVTIQFGANIPRHCHHDDNRSNWHEVKETVTDCNQLPKLTEEVFDRPECPAWARYAAVNKFGKGFYFRSEPEKMDHAWKLPPDCKIDNIGKFDASDWENSLIKRPPKVELPDWCKVGEWVYDASMREYLYVKEKDYDWYVDPVARGRIKQARPRPFNEKEMKALVGKVIEDSKNRMMQIVAYEDNKVVTLLKSYTASDLIRDNITMDGKPCYKLEHQNDKGEWVK